MSESSEIISTLKRAIKTSGMTYANVANELSVSEATIKRIFSVKHCSLERIEEICTVLHIQLTDLIHLHELEKNRVKQLTYEQEQQLTADPALLFIAVCIRNNWLVDEITQQYRFTEHEITRLLIKLDKLGLIDLLPGNRYKLRVSSDFRWIDKGPIEKFYEKNIQQDFLSSHFTEEGELRLFLTGAVSQVTQQKVLGKLAELSADFAAWHKADLNYPIQSRVNVSVLLAARSWEMALFKQFQK